MSANIFVDIAATAEMSEGNVASLSEIFRQYLNKNSDADIHTKPAVVLIEDDLMKIFSTKATFEFETSSGEISYTVLKRERNETDIFEKCFNGDLYYVAENYRKDASQVIMALTTMFIRFFGDGKDGLRETVSAMSKGRFDYDQNKRGEYRFWYRKNNGDWVRSSLCLFTDYLYNTFSTAMKHSNSDAYLVNQLIEKDKSHTGYMFIAYANFLAAQTK